MCTVTFLPGPKGYRLGMNRDESLSRVQGLPPQRTEVAGRTVLAPSEPGGGTWIGLNDCGTCLALINWYSVSRRATGKTVSRGEIIRAASTAEDTAAVDAVLTTLPLQRINPFRLIGVFAHGKAVTEWRWDLQRIERKEHPWRARQWVSSGFDESAAQRIRGRIFRMALRQKSAGTLEWLRRLHRSHAPQRGAFSTCMHRPEAATVSYTEVLVTSRSATMRYHAGPPCSSAKCSRHARVELQPRQEDPLQPQRSFRPERKPSKKGSL